MSHSNEHLAVVGVACLFPGAHSPEEYWRNIIAGRDLIGPVPPDRWRLSDYYDPDPRAPDKTYCRRGGFITAVDFDPLEFGLQPRNLPATDPSQILALIVARDALRSAFGRGLERLDRDRTAVVLGAAPLMELSGMMGMRAAQPHVRRALEETGLPAETIERAMTAIGLQTVEWQETTFPGMLANVIAGRIAGRFDLHGSNYTIDAACASSLTALGIAADELARGRATAVLCGGSDTSNSGLAFVAFSKTPALSPTEDCRPFSDKADGTLLGEGVAMLVVKRLVDAERDDDVIHAVIRGVATSSDGRAKSIFAPNAAGQELALERAYAAAGVSPRSVELLEAHGTGTRVGDAEEVLSASRVFARNLEVDRPWCAIGSVKSQIGHTKCAAGVAGALKAILALRHGTLPPTIKVDKPNARLLESGVPFYVNTRARPWIRGADHPRRAAVTALGFGGTNAHVVLEDYQGPGRRPPAIRAFPSELVVLSAESAQGLATACLELAASAKKSQLSSLAHASQQRFEATAGWRFATVAESCDDLVRRLEQAASAVTSGRPTPRVHVGSGGVMGPIALLFPGQGSQDLEMGADIAMAFRTARDVWDQYATEPLLAGLALHEVVFPPPAMDSETLSAQVARLTDTRWAQPALGVTELASWSLLRELGLAPAMTLGHSFGELAALHVAGVMDAATLVSLATARGRAVHRAAGDDGAMVAISAPHEEVAALCSEAGVTLANDNSPLQTVASGRAEAIAGLEARLAARGIGAKRLPVATAFHSPLVAPAAETFAETLANVTLEGPRLEVYANTTAAPYRPDGGETKRLLAEQIVAPVRFRECVLAMYEAGARIFVDVGPGATLARFVEDTLADRPHLVVRMSTRGTHGVTAFQEGLARLSAAGVPLAFDALWADYEIPRPPADPPKFSVKVNGRIHGAPYPPAEGDIKPVPSAPMRPLDAIPHALAPTTAVDSVASPALPPKALPPKALLPNVSLPDAVSAIHARLDEAQARFERYMSESHLAFLKLAETALRELSAGGVPPHGPSREQSPAPAFEPAVPDALPVPDTSPLESRLLAIVSERTGYPVELLGLDMLLEADLGIDSIRRMEILTHFLGMDPGQAAASLDSSRSAELARLATLGDVLAFVRAEAPNAPAPAPTPAPAMLAPAGGPQSELHHPYESQALEQKLLAVVSDRTGYPVDLLALDMKLEADLGIDSIRRMEILTHFQGSDLGNAAAAATLDAGRAATLARLETLGDVLAFLRAEVAALAETSVEPSPREHTAGSDGTDGSAGSGCVVLARRLVPVLAPSESTRTWAPTTSVAVLGASTLARAIIHELGARGIRASTELEPNTRAVIHTGPVDCDAGPEASLRLQTDLLSSVQQALKGSAHALERFAIVQQQGGDFGVERLEPRAASASGGSAWLRTLKLEHPAVLVRLIDVAPELAPQVAARLVVDGIAEEGELDELGLRSESLRYTRVVAPAQRRSRARTSRASDGGLWVVSGGARGITVDILREVAGSVRPKLLVLGRTHETSPDEDLPATSDVATLQQALAARWKNAGQHIDLALLRAEATAQARGFELRHGLAALREAGLEVAYAAVDVSDPAGVQAAVAAARRAHGPITGLVHAAGVIADKRLEDKTRGQLETVFRTKVHGLVAMLHATQADPLELVCGFSSIAAVRGSAGQADYAAANLVMTDLLRVEARRRGMACRAHALAFGPVAGGMMSPALQALYRERGVPLIALATAARTAAKVLVDGEFDDVELILVPSETVI